ncbi:MAG: hypothetical protein R3236_06100, partial [Phycisphaeraceae bacterium]|nr:hypothetical protein [Phycisphaeraceae bacterium]
MSFFGKLFGWLGGGGHSGGGVDQASPPKQAAARSQATSSSTGTAQASAPAKFKMIAVDIDGTLVNSQRQLTRPVVEAVRE